MTPNERQCKQIRKAVLVGSTNGGKTLHFSTTKNTHKTIAIICYNHKDYDVYCKLFGYKNWNGIWVDDHANRMIPVSRTKQLHFMQFDDYKTTLYSLQKENFNELLFESIRRLKKNLR